MDVSVIKEDITKKEKKYFTEKAFEKEVPRELIPTCIPSSIPPFLKELNKM